jgi:Spy/CpxP family protein refolding chaperone
MGRGFGRGADGANALNLSESQRSQLKSIHEGNRSQISAIRNDAALTQEQKMEKIRSLHQSRRQQLSTILTPEQQQKIKQHRHSRRGRHEGRRDGLSEPKRDM